MTPKEQFIAELIESYKIEEGYDVGNSLKYMLDNNHGLFDKYAVKLHKLKNNIGFIIEYEVNKNLDYVGIYFSNNSHGWNMTASYNFLIDCLHFIVKENNF